MNQRSPASDPSQDDTESPDSATADEGAKPPRSRARRWFRRALWCGGVGAVLFVAFLSWLYFGCLAEPPELTERPPILDFEVRRGDNGRTYLGESWFEERPGHSRIFLTGDPFTIGYANSTLTAAFMRQQEESLIGTVREYFPSPISFSAVAVAVIVNNRNLPDYVPLEYQHEIHGLATGGTDPFPEYGPRYHRILNYHAAHDISHWVWDQPIVGCTAFAAAGEATSDGHLIVGRNFDFEAGRHFDTNKLIGLYQPQQGHAFLSVSWPGMAGAVTGMNDAKIFCSINGAHSEDRGNIGTPVSIIVRQVLQYADSIETATAFIRDGQVFVSDSYLVADGKTGEAVVIEKSPGKCGVRALANGTLLQANHFETDTFAHDVGNLAYQEQGTSLARRARLSALIEQHRGVIDVERAVEILRDTECVSDDKAELPTICLGHRSAINGLIATHAVVADATTGTLWVSRGPHQLGAFDAYTIEDFGRSDAPSIPADALLTDGRYDRTREHRAAVAAAEAQFNADGQLGPDTIRILEQLLTQDPHRWRALLLLARAREASEELDAARDLYRRAQHARPPFRVDRERIGDALDRLSVAGKSADAPSLQPK